MSFVHACRCSSIPSFLLPCIASFMSAFLLSFIVSRIIRRTCFVGCYLTVPKPSAYSFFCRTWQIPHLASGPSLAQNLYRRHVWSHIGILECHIELGLLALLSPEAQAGHKVVCFQKIIVFLSVVSVAIEIKFFFCEIHTFLWGACFSWPHSDECSLAHLWPC